ncbi:MAG: hypothetical protein ABFR89_09520 [Actinomycetota bacterium]
MSQRSATHRFVRYWWVWAIGALVAWAITAAAGKGFAIIELELAGSAAKADEVMRGADVDAVRATILWDFLFLALYAPTLFFGSLWAREQFRSPLQQKVGLAAAAGGLVAGLLDVIENLAMLGYLNDWGGLSDWMPLAAVMAIPKFAFVVFAIAYIVAGAVFAVRRRLVDG